MHRHVVSHGNDLTTAVENRARVIAALFDVGREGGSLERGSHLFGDGVIEILEDLEFDRIAAHKVDTSSRSLTPHARSPTGISMVGPRHRHPRRRIPAVDAKIY